MKAFMFAAALSVAAIGQAQAVPNSTDAHIQGRFVCKLVESPDTKLIVRIDGSAATAHYASDENIHHFELAQRTARTVTFRGANGFLTFRLPARRGVIRASGEIRGDLGPMRCRHG